jgi:hypothetical protein
VGVATLVPDERWPDVRLLDVFAHPQVAATNIVALIRALPPQPGNIQCFTGATQEDTAKIDALEQAGFARAAVLPDQFRQGDSWRDAWLYSRRENGLQSSARA